MVDSGGTPIPQPYIRSHRAPGADFHEIMKKENPLAVGPDRRADPVADDLELGAVGPDTAHAGRVSHHAPTIPADAIPMKTCANLYGVLAPVAFPYPSCSPGTIDRAGDEAHRERAED
jgi:hypothetical protein